MSELLDCPFPDVQLAVGGPDVHVSADDFAELFRITEDLLDGCVQGDCYLCISLLCTQWPARRTEVVDKLLPRVCAAVCAAAVERDAAKGCTALATAPVAMSHLCVGEGDMAAALHAFGGVDRLLSLAVSASVMKRHVTAGALLQILETLTSRWTLAGLHLGNKTAELLGLLLAASKAAATMFHVTLKLLLRVGTAVPGALAHLTDSATFLEGVCEHFTHGPVPVAVDTCTTFLGLMKVLLDSQPVYAATLALEATFTHLVLEWCNSSVPDVVSELARHLLLRVAPHLYTRREEASHPLVVMHLLSTSAVEFQSHWEAEQPICCSRLYLFAARQLPCGHKVHDGCVLTFATSCGEACSVCGAHFGTLYRHRMLM